VMGNEGHKETAEVNCFSYKCSSGDAFAFDFSSVLCEEWQNFS